MQSVIGNHGRIKPGARGLRAIALILLLGSLLSLSQWPRPVAGGAAPALQGSQNFVQQQKLVASDGERTDQFGVSVAVSDETIVVGVPFDNGGGGKGSAYVFARSGTGWTERQKLMPSDGVDGDFFGHSVAISGGTIVIGAPSVGQGGGEDPGAAYVFARSGTGWIQQQKLLASDGTASDEFGFSVAIEDGTIVAGARDGDNLRGSAYVFARGGTGWIEQQKITASDPGRGDLFGQSVAISGETIVVGAPSVNGSAGLDQGAAYVFARSGTSWTQQQKLEAGSPGGGDIFGLHVAISGETIVAGAPNYDGVAGADQGAAYVFARSGTSWTEQQKLLAGDPGMEEVFGVRVVISGEIIVVSAWGFDDGNNQGAAYVFARNGTSWIQRQKLLADDGAMQNFFGWSIAISGETIVIGARGASGAGGFFQGAAYVFAIPPNTAPVASCQSVTVAAGSDCRAAASIDNGSFDPDADSITITQSPPGPYPLGKTTVELTVTDSLGASGSCSAVVKVEDQTAPVVKASARKADNTPYIAGTWTDQTVTVRFDCSDFCSGIVSCPADVVLDATGVFALASGSATDGAGNKGSAGFGPIMIDKTPPVVSLTGVTPGAIYPLGAVPAAACNTTDAHSGVATAATLVVGGGNAQGVGTFNVGCVGATDKVGNRSPLAAFIYTVVYNMNKFVALAQEGVELEQRVSVLSGDVGARARSAGPFIRDGAEVSVGQEVEMLDPNSHLLGDSIFIRQLARVYNPSYNELTNQGTILGAPVSPLTLSLIPALPALPAITPGTQNFEVEQQGTLTLGAGGYGALVARQLATITFTGGVYHFQSWDVGQQVKLHFLAPTEIRISGRLRVDQRGYLGPAPSAPGLAARDIVIYVAGQNGQSGALGAVPEAAEFGQETTLSANVIVPNGTLHLRQRVEATGAFFGKWLRAGQQVKLALDSRFGL